MFFLWRNLHRLKRSSPHPNKLVKGFFGDSKMTESFLYSVTEKEKKLWGKEKYTENFFLRCFFHVVSSNKVYSLKF